MKPQLSLRTYHHRTALKVQALPPCGMRHDGGTSQGAPAIGLQPWRCEKLLVAFDKPAVCVQQKPQPFAFIVCSDQSSAPMSVLVSWMPGSCRISSTMQRVNSYSSSA